MPASSLVFELDALHLGFGNEMSLRVVEVLSVVERMPLAILVGVCGAEQVDQHERSGAIAVDAAAIVDLDGLPETTTRAQRNRVLDEVANAIEAHGVQDWSPAALILLDDALRTSDRCVPDLHRRAARTRLLIGDIDGAAASARRALEQAPADSDLAHLLSMALEAIGQHGAASAVSSGAGADDQPAAWGRWASNLFISTGHRPEVPDSISASDDHNEWIANRAWIEAMDGDVAAVAASTAAVLDDPSSSPQAVVWVCAVGSVCAAIDGSASVARRLSRHGRSVSNEALQTLTPFASLQVDLSEFLAEVRLGDLPRARSLAVEALDSDPVPFLTATWSCFAGIAARESGRFADGLELFDAGLAEFDGDPFGLVSWARSERSVCAAMTSTHVGPSGDEGDSGLYRSALARNRSWVLAAGGDVDRAVESADEALEIAAERGQNAHQLLALVDIARFGEPRRAASSLSELSDHRSPLIRAGAEVVMALVDNDQESLISAAKAASAIDHGVWADEMYHRARDTALRVGNRHRAAALEIRCRRQSVPTPISQESAESDWTITPREQQVARLAVDGEASLSIAHELDLSVRTVDNLLGRVYSKCGVAGRVELIEVVASWGASFVQASST